MLKVRRQDADLLECGDKRSAAPLSASYEKSGVARDTACRAHSRVDAASRRIVHRYDAPVRWYVWGGGRLLAVVEADGVVRYAHSDEQGSVVALTNAAGTVTDPFCYGPYGTDWGRSGTNSIPFRWLGSHGVLAAASLSNSSLLIPNSSLYLTRHRAYDAALGRFLSADPLGLGGGPNVYAYCLGNPLAYIDPLGLCAEAVGDFVADTFFNKEDIALAWELASKADYGTLRGWGEGAVGLVGGVALTADAVFNLIPGKAAASAAIKTGAKEAFEVGAKAVAKTMAREASGEVAEKAAKSGIHKNSLEYIGDTHVYRIKGPDGTTFKIGESARGVRSVDGLSIRAEDQVRRLQRETGDTFSSEIRKTFGSKAEARDYERKLIERFRRMYGEEALPGNKSYH